MLTSDPLAARPIGERAVDTMTASGTIGSLQRMRVRPDVARHTVRGQAKANLARRRCGPRSGLRRSRLWGQPPVGTTTGAGTPVVGRRHSRDTIRRRARPRPVRAEPDVDGNSAANPPVDSPKAEHNAGSSWSATSA